MSIQKKNKSSENISRRSFIKTASQISSATLAATAVLYAKTARSPSNIIFVICDQMRGDALSILGNPNARTPNLDAMAESGVLFENSFSNNPVCIPSRKSIFTGMHPHQHGSLTNNDGSLLPFKDSMMDYFKKRGYRIGWVGKNHTFKKQEFKNFDSVGIRAREPFRKYSRYVPPHWHGDTYWPDEQCYPKKNTDEAIDFLRNTKNGEPFFLHVSYFDPHPPYMAPSKFSSQFCSADMKIPEFIEPEVLSGRLADYARAMGMGKISDTDLTETMRYYYAAIAWGVDAQIGRLLRALQEQGLENNTIVVFTADHGDFMGHHNMVRKGMFLYDALLHVPMIWYAPGQLPNGRRVKNLAQGIDIFPTLIDLTGGERRSDLEGRSLKSVLDGETINEDGFFIYTSAGYNELDFQRLEKGVAKDDETPLHTCVLRQNMNPKLRTKSIRNRKWKLIMSESRPLELYHMDGGHIERENVAKKTEFTDVRGKLEKRLRDWWPW
jgi:arylsulfatase A-like enzyme